ncbi:MAG: hypothetical protein J5379_01745 [Clostridiales bacterium]|nr:hypothetical protein [Clostridiales bacterium]
MLFIFTSFEYSNKATLFAILMDLIAYGLGLGGIIVLLLAIKFGPLFILIGLLMIAAAIFFYFFLGNVIGARIAANDFKKKIRTDPIVALNYVNNGRATYEEIAAINPAFAQKYEVNAFGKVTLRRH